MDRGAWWAVAQGVRVRHDWATNHIEYLGFPDGSAVKNLPAMQELQETQVWTLGQEDPLEKEMSTHSSILAWKILWTEEPGSLRP